MQLSVLPVESAQEPRPVGVTTAAVTWVGWLQLASPRRPDTWPFVSANPIRMVGGGWAFPMQSWGGGGEERRGASLGHLS